MSKVTRNGNWCEIDESEPIYTYIKGKGWVVNPPNLITTKDRQNILIEVRDPEPGDKYMYAGTPSGSKPWGLEQWTDYLKSNHLGDLSKYLNYEFWNDNLKGYGYSTCIIKIV